MKTVKAGFVRFARDYGMVFVLLILGTFFSILTIELQFPTGRDAAEKLVAKISEHADQGGSVILIARSSQDGQAFVEELSRLLGDKGIDVHGAVVGDPVDAREMLEQSVADSDNLSLDAIVCDKSASNWGLIDNLEVHFPSLSDCPVIVPEGYYYPNFLKTQNLRNVANQCSVIAIIAIGMTMVIITAGIDLSVGSLVALSAVSTTLLIRDWFGSYEATPIGMSVSALAGISICAASGLMTGIFVTRFGIAPFIVTLAVMSIARGSAQLANAGESVYEVPASFSHFANGTMLGINHSILLMIGLYIAAHLLMSHTKLGRYIYAVGGNREAARLSGVPVGSVLVFVYVACGALAGLGGVIEASRLGSGSPLYGNMYELYVIAAVVVGGTSLAGGEGKVLGTLIGALIIAVIRNGMNLMEVESYTQGVVMGVLILAAVLIDMWKKKRWRQGR